MTLFFSLLFTCIYLLNPCTCQTTTSTVRFWTCKVKVGVTMKYTLSSLNATLSEIALVTDGLIVIDSQTQIDSTTKLEAETDYKAYVDVDLIQSDTFPKTMTLNFTIWTDNGKFFNAMRTYLISAEFGADLIDEMENENAELEMDDEVETNMIDTHGDEEAKWYDEWLDFAAYTYFQWMIFGCVVLAIFIGCFCLIYCCVCRTSDSTDPYSNVDLQLVGQRSPNSK
eukprot:UN02077